MFEGNLAWQNGLCRIGAADRFVPSLPRRGQTFLGAKVRLLAPAAQGKLTRRRLHAATRAMSTLVIQRAAGPGHLSLDFNGPNATGVERVLQVDILVQKLGLLLLPQQHLGLGDD